MLLAPTSGVAYYERLHESFITFSGTWCCYAVEQPSYGGNGKFSPGGLEQVISVARLVRTLRRQRSFEKQLPFVLA